MARIRSVKPEFFRSRKLAECSPRARLTFIGIWIHADDEGRYQYEPELLKADLWPWEPDIGPKETDACVAELVDRGRLCQYEHGGHTYLHVVNWGEHQKISHKSESRLPACPRETHGGSPDPSGTLRSPPEGSRDTPEDSGGLRPDLGSRKRDLGSRIPPTADRSAIASPAPVTPIPTAQTFVAAYVDAYRGRTGHDPPPTVKGQLARHLRQALEAGFPPEQIRETFVEWFEADCHPSVLPSMLEVKGRGGRPRRRTRQQEQRDQLVETDAAMERWAAQRMRERGENGERGRVDGADQAPQPQLPRPGAAP